MERGLVGHSRVLAFMLCGKHAKEGTVTDDYIYVAMNMYHDALELDVPGLPEPMQWRVAVNTSAPPPEDIWDRGASLYFGLPSFHVGGQSVAILVGR